VIASAMFVGPPSDGVLQVTTLPGLASIGLDQNRWVQNRYKIRVKSDNALGAMRLTSLTIRQLRSAWPTILVARCLCVLRARGSGDASVTDRTHPDLVASHDRRHAPPGGDLECERPAGS